MARTATAKTKQPENRRGADNRRDAVLDAAAALFRSRGFHATSMRDIAAGAGMLAGSIYYHFPSKEALLLAVYGEGVRRIAEPVADAVAEAPDDAWARLEAAAAAHMSALLDGGDYGQVVIRVLPDDVPQAAGELAALREGYEAPWRHLCEALDPPPGGDAGSFRRLLLGAMNWSRVWYHPGAKAPADIARDFLAAFARPARRSTS